MEKILLHAVVGDENIRKAIAVIVGEGNAKSSALFGGDAGALADIFESTIAAIAIEQTGGRGESRRRAVGVPVAATNFVVIGIPFHVARDEKIEMAVIVVVEESCGDGPAAAGDAGLGGYIGEGAIAIVVIQNIFSVTGDDTDRDNRRCRNRRQRRPSRSCRCPRWQDPPLAVTSVKLPSRFWR